MPEHNTVDTVMTLLPEEGLEVVKKLNDTGFEAFFVGGIIRDLLMGKPSKDIDITTNATPNQVKGVFDGNKIIDTGIEHGTVTLILKGKSIEITTYRQDGQYTDHRRPDKVCYSPYLEQDLSRRDFTVNAMAWSSAPPAMGGFKDKLSKVDQPNFSMEFQGVQSTGHGYLVDLFEGQKDLESKKIRCVGDPQKRFEEDALRVLRALRFAATWGFTLEEKTKEALWMNKESLRFLAKERIQKELSKLLLGSYAPEVLVEYQEIISKLLGLCAKTKISDEIGEQSLTWAKRCDLLGLLPKKEGLRLGALWEKGCSQEILLQRKWSKKTAAEVVSLHNAYNEKWKNNRFLLKKRIGEKGSQKVEEELLFIQQYLSVAGKEQQSKKINEIIQVCQEITENHECVRLSQLDITGKDLLQLGFHPSVYLGQILQDLLEKVMKDQLPNKKEALMLEAKKYKKP